METPDSDWRQAGFEGAIGQAIELGIGLKEIGNAASEMAIKLALEREQGNLHRAASRLGVTHRALQLRGGARGRRGGLGQDGDGQEGQQGQEGHGAAAWDRWAAASPSRASARC